MTEQNHTNLTAGDYKDNEKADDEFIPEDAWPVCSKCLKPCNPLQNYCDNCDSNEVINSLSSYMPFIRIRFNAGMFGKLWHKIWHDKNTSIIYKLFYLFLIILGAPVLLVVGVPWLLISKIKNPLLQKAARMIFLILLFTLLTYLYFV
jgi:hypothetical protein